MPDPASSQPWVDLAAQVTDALRRRQGTVERRADGELWLDHNCLFHPDRVRSASWQPDTRVYYCRHQGEKFALEEVARQLYLDRGPSQTTHVHDEPFVPKIESARLTYTYVWPRTGERSHLKDRIEFADGSKEFRFRPPDGQGWGKPKEHWPLYGDYGIRPGSYVLVVEGEKCVDHVYAMQDSKGAPIVALTAGSAPDLGKFAGDLASRLSEVSPLGIVLWPDNDAGGIEAMEKVARSLRSVGLSFATLKPAEWDLPMKGDVADYLEAGGSLAVVVDKLCAPPTAGTKARELADTVTVLSPQVYVFPGTRRTGKLQLEEMRSIWFHRFGRLPTSDQANELLARLRIRGYQDPTRSFYRLATYPDRFFWRPASTGQCYRVDAGGIERDDDPPDGLLVVPEVEPLYPTEVAEGGRQDFEGFCAPFNLNPTELAMLEGWLVTAFMGLQTPILLMRGAAATGKSTFARLVLGVVEPVGVEIDASKQINQDPRELLRTLQTSPAILLDNVSSLTANLEDVLSKLVTGYTTSLRTLYADLVEILRFQKAILVTTTNWDVYKGDLASRIVVTQPKTNAGQNWISDRDARDQFGEVLPRVRGYIFGRCVEVYRRWQEHRGKTTPFRIGDLGQVFLCLGFDVNRLARDESVAKSEVINQNEPWLDAIVSLWKLNQAQAPFDFATTDLCAYISSFGVDDPPKPSSPKLARWMEEKQFIFRDHGFSLTKITTDKHRGYRFAHAEQPVLVPAPVVTEEPIYDGT